MSTTSTTTTSRVDLYQRVTNRIIEQLEQGVLPWQSPWKAVHAAGNPSRPLRFNGTPYSGINILSLWMEAECRGFVSPFYLSYRQAQELGGQVRKGEHGVKVVYANTFTKKEQNESGEEVEREIAYYKEYTVFSADQIEGLPQHYYALVEQPRTEPLMRNERVDRFVDQTGANIQYGGNRACYSPSEDLIRMPYFETFRDAAGFSSTICHELVHWTKAETRLNRDFGRKRFGDDAYCVEELVAELGAAFLCADLSITPEVREDHAAYIQSWLKVLRGDSRAIFHAASHASKAVDYLHGLQPQPKD